MVINVFIAILLSPSLPAMQFPVCLQEVQLQGASISLYVPDRNAVKEAYEKGFISFPYWSQVWPSAKALTHFVVNNPDYTNAKRVVELGAGLGLPSLVAARNAKAVLCTDYSNEAIEVVRQSAAHLHLENLTAETINWQNLPDNLETDVLLLSDVNYEPTVFASLLNIIVSFLAKGTTVLISTPQRLMAKDFISSLLIHCVRQEEIVIMHEGNNVSITVLVLQML